MALKLIKRGTAPQDIVHKKTCPTCNSEYEYTQADLTWSNDPRESGAFFECTVCKSFVWHR